MTGSFSPNPITALNLTTYFCTWHFEESFSPIFGDILNEIPDAYSNSGKKSFEIKKCFRKTDSKTKTTFFGRKFETLNFLFQKLPKSTRFSSEIYFLGNVAFRKRELMPGCQDSTFLMNKCMQNDNSWHFCTNISCKWHSDTVANIINSWIYWIFSNKNLALLLNRN